MRAARLLRILAVSIPALVLAVGLAGQANEDPAGEPAIYTPDQLQWKNGPPSLPRGAKLAVLEGNPSAEGPFTMRLKFPNGYRIPPHTHPKTERLTVISGTFRLGMGEKFDEKALRS